MIGGAGNDTYIVENDGDKTVEAPGEGTDTVKASLSWTLDVEIEKLTLTGTSAINGTGNALANTMTGNSGANILDGGIGADAMTGGAGNDVYVVDNTSDQTIEVAGGGTDTVQSSISWALSSEIENLSLTGAAAISGTGNTLANTLQGNSGANTLNGGMGADIMTGGSGNDVYVVDNTGDRTTEAAGGGTDTVQSAITWTLSTEIENLTLIGTAAINGTGNILANTLLGNSGANTLNGGTGADAMTGGAGNDIYIVDNAGDRTTEAAAGGTDTVQSSITWTLGTEVENLTLIGTAAINGTGNALANTLLGNSGANTLNGGIGADVMIGGAGNDIYIVDNAGDQTTESAGGGTDTVQSALTWTLSSEVENLTLIGTAAINGTGNILANTLLGNSAANTLNGGTGADVMTGGAGNDVYVVDNAGDRTTEAASGGTDTVQSSITWTLSTEVENLTLIGTAAINGTGNTLANTLTGNAGDNILDGGTGVDTLIGGAGNDTYVVDGVSDIILELAAGGTDLVQSSVTLTLGAELENLTLMGTAALNGTGNALSNVLTGNAAANILTGGDGNDTLNGGSGSDTLVGGVGNDIYVVESIGDVITEAVNEGTDTVQSSITWTLGANIERLTLTGTAAVNATGNALSNVLVGNSGNNILTGDAGNDTLNGGAGSDTMIGGVGNDTYVVDVATDVVTEAASAGTDTVQTSISLTLGTNVENLTLTGTTAINGTGNTLDNVLTGNAANNTLNGGTGVDTLKGMLGADTLTGGTGIDTFVFVTGDDADTITDFDAVGADHDIINLAGLASITDYADLTANHMTQSGANVLINGLDGDTITVKNVTLANMVAADFLF